MSNKDPKKEPSKRRDRLSRSSPSFWLFKSEPSSYSIDQLQEDGVTLWDGVRNYQARNFLKEEVQEGDLILFYHSNSKPSAVVGLARVAGPSKPDPTAFDPSSIYFDPKSRIEKPSWWVVPVAYMAHATRPLSLAEIKATPALSGMKLAQKGDRLSVQPVTREDFIGVCRFCGLERYL